MGTLRAIKNFKYSGSKEYLLNFLFQAKVETKDLCQSIELQERLIKIGFERKASEDIPFTNSRYIVISNKRFWEVTQPEYSHKPWKRLPAERILDFQITDDEEDQETASNMEDRTKLVAYISKGGSLRETSTFNMSNRNQHKELLELLYHVATSMEPGEIITIQRI